MEISMILLRLVTTFLLALIFGLERKRAHKTIGFVTYVFVAVGACGLALTAETLYPENPLSLLGAIVTGIGFLGAGALIRTSDKVFGFSTAASIWVFAIFGLIIGIGEYLIAITIYVMIFVIVLLDNNSDKIFGSFRQKKVIINTNRIVDEKEISALLDNKKHMLIGMDLDKKGSKLSATYLVYGTMEGINNISCRMSEKEWFDSIRIE